MSGLNSCQRAACVTAFVAIAGGWGGCKYDVPQGTYACQSAADCEAGWSCVQWDGAGKVCVPSGELDGDVDSNVHVDTLSDDLLDGLWSAQTPTPEEYILLALDQTGASVTGEITQENGGDIRGWIDITDGSFVEARLIFDYLTLRGAYPVQYDLTYDPANDWLVGTWIHSHAGPAGFDLTFERAERPGS